MTIAIDCGAAPFRALRRSERGLVGHSLSAVYCAAPHTPGRFEACEHLRLPVVVGDNRMAVLGDDIPGLPELLQSPQRSLLASHDNARDGFVFGPGVDALLAALLPEAGYIGELCGFTAADCPGARRAARMIHERGYRLVKVSPAHAVVLAELASDSFTGLGLSLGAESSEISLCHLGVELDRCHLPIGGNWIDEEVARENGSFFPSREEAPLVNSASAKAWKESLTESICHARDSERELLADLYRNLLKDLLSDAAERFSLNRRIHLAPQPMTLMCAGGPTGIRGFTDILEQALLTTPFPVRIDRILLATHGGYASARGALIAAELEASVFAYAPARAKLAS